MQGLKQKKINFIERLQENPKRDAQTISRLRIILPLAGLLLVILLVYGYFSFFLQGDLQKRQDVCTAFLEDSAVQRDYKKVTDLISQKDSLQLQVENTKLVFDNLGSYAEMNKRMYNAFNLPAVEGAITVNDYTFDRATGVLVLNCAGTNELAASGYVEMLRVRNNFVAVTYTGYSGSEGEFTFAVTCLVKSGEGAAL